MCLLRPRLLKLYLYQARRAFIALPVGLFIFSRRKSVLDRWLLWCLVQSTASACGSRKERAFGARRLPSVWTICCFMVYRPSPSLRRSLTEKIVLAVTVRSKPWCHYFHPITFTFFYRSLVHVCTRMCTCVSSVLTSFRWKLSFDLSFGVTILFLDVHHWGGIGTCRPLVTKI